MISRRQMLETVGQGFGGLALAGLLHAEEPTSTAGARAVGLLHNPPKAKRIVQLFMAGAASHLDLFDYKPALEKYHGEESDFGEHVEAFQNGLGPWMKSPFKFREYGECGKPLSEAVAPLGEVVDEMTFIHNLVGKTGVHSQATYLQSTGFDTPGFPGMGCWISYALGSMNDNLPTFVVLPDRRGFASNGPKNWGAAFLPAQYQGTMIRLGMEDPIADLLPKSEFVSRESDARAIELLSKLNRQHQASRQADSRLEARIKSYELAAKMQLSAPEALDISQEPQYIRKMYGLEHGKSEFD